MALTESGTTPLLMSRISSGLPIFAMSPHNKTLAWTNLYRGVTPVMFDGDETKPSTKCAATRWPCSRRRGCCRVVTWCC